MIRPSSFSKPYVLVGVLALAPSLVHALSWKNLANRQALSNATLTAKVQGGFLYELIDNNTGFKLVNNHPASLSSVLPIFGSTQLDLAQASATLTARTPTSLNYHLSWPGGISWNINWSINGTDLVLNTSASPSSAVPMLSFLIEGCDISSHQLVMVDVNGVASSFNSGWAGVFGDPNKQQMPQTFVHPLVALFQGANSGWIVEGRDLQIGPSVVRGFGKGLHAEIMFSRGYMHLPTAAPLMYEIRFRTYSGAWTDAVDPYIDWMENVLQFVPLDEKPQAWVTDIRNQAYVVATDFDGLADLNMKISPSKTYLGRQAEYRFFGFDQGFPDYEPTPKAASWIQQAVSDGYHVGVHVNVGGIDRDNTALIQQFEPGLQQIGTGSGGVPIYDGTPTHVYCSAAYAPWRAHLVQAISSVVAAGATVIYLDQTNGVLGKFFVNGMTGIQGVQVLMQEIQAAYPQVVIQTEQFNPMSSRFASFALTTLDLGHPLSGHIFSRFIKIVPEGIFYQPTDVDLMNQFMHWGHFVPGASTESSWLEIANAFADFDLSPSAALPLASNQLSGFVGPNGVEAYFQTTATTRSLVVLEPGQSPQEFGIRHENITTWPGPGALADWLIYDGSMLKGLKPSESYVFDPAVTPDPTRFHITSIPGNYQGFKNVDRRIISQEIGSDDDHFRVFFAGNGLMSIFVPDSYDVYLDGVAVPIDRNMNRATFVANAALGFPSELLVYRRSERYLSGFWSNLGWSRPLHKSYHLSVSDSLFPNSFFTLIAGTGFVTGRIPEAPSIRATGSFGLRDEAVFSTAAGVMKINGKEVLRIPPGSGPPYRQMTFDIDLTAYASQHVFVEFTADGVVSGPDAGDWKEPSFDVSGIVLDPMGNPRTGNGWSSLDVVSVRSSSAHMSRPFTQTIDGSGLDTSTGELHTYLSVNTTMGLTGLGSGAVSRGGTAEGSHWVEYSFDDPFELDAIWVWNYNEQNFPNFGMKSVTIEVSESGSSDPADWSPIFTGDIPRAAGGGNTDTAVSLALGTGSVTARHVVITMDLGDDRNHSDGVFDEVGLSEIRFFGTVVEPPPPPTGPDDIVLSIVPSTVTPGTMTLSWPSRVNRVYVLERAIDMRTGFTQPSSPMGATPPLNSISIGTAGTDEAAFRIRAIPTQ